MNQLQIEMLIKTQTLDALKIISQLVAAEEVDTSEFRYFSHLLTDGCEYIRWGQRTKQESNEEWNG